jgi:outer membrane protein OmpA-like peptidoglycan-associated protein
VSPAKSQPLLDQIAAALRAHPELDVRVQGHTDNVGRRDYNDKLSQERAEAVENALKRRGISGGRLHAKGFGEARPIASNQTKGGRAKNRRVEFVTKD